MGLAAWIRTPLEKVMAHGKIEESKVIEHAWMPQLVRVFARYCMKLPRLLHINHFEQPRGFEDDGFGISNSR